MKKYNYNFCRTLIKDKSVSFTEMWHYVAEYCSIPRNQFKYKLIGKIIWYRFFHLGHRFYGNTLANTVSEIQEKKYPGSKRMFEAWNSNQRGYVPSELNKLLHSGIPLITTNEIVDVIIPVYNGIEYLKKLIPLLFANTSQPHRFIFIDDCSPDSKTVDYISEMIRNRSDSILIRNNTNLGFTGTVNYGSGFAKGKYMVLLNTDVMVPPLWLERLISPLLADETIGTTTPFTNGGVFFSYPNFGGNHRLESPDDFLEIDRQFQRFGLSTDADLEFVNGVGFCMAIRRECWDKFGALDVKAFGKGYGEECDLCMRFLKNGYRNVLVPNLYVYHNHGGSFDPDEKKSLVEAHQKILQKRWSGYLNLIHSFVYFDPWAKYRLAILDEQYAHNVDCLFIDLDSERGGACKFRIQQEEKLLSEGKKVASILYTSGQNTSWKLSLINKDGRSEFKLSGFGQVEQWISHLSPKEIVINNFAFCDELDYLLSYFAGAYSYECNDSEDILPIELKVNEESSFPISFVTENIHRLTFIFGTHCKTIDGTLNISITKGNGKILYSKIVDTSVIKDNSPFSIFLSEDEQHNFYQAESIHIKYCPQNDTDKLSLYVNTLNLPIYSYSSKENNDDHPALNCQRMVYCYHDFLSCCPSFFLMNKHDVFCEFKDCGKKCLLGNNNTLYPSKSLEDWCSKWKSFLYLCTEYRFFSNNTYNLVSHFYKYDSNKVNIQGHHALVTFKSKFKSPSLNAPLRIGVVGAWYPSKGSKKVLELSELLKQEDPNARIFFYGLSNHNHRTLKLTNRNIVWKGRYDIEKLPDLLVEDGISVVFFASVYPETYSFVTRECMDIGVPIVSFNIGASGDRIKEYDKGLVIDGFAVTDVYKKILEARSRFH